MDFDEIVVKESPGLCRCCLSEGCYKDLGSEYSWMSETEIYADMLLECFDISISQHPTGPNGSNRLICEVCITRLRDACNFKKQVLESEKKFVDMVGRGEFRPKVLLYQTHMKTEQIMELEEEVGADDAGEVEYLEEDADFVDEDLLKNEDYAEASVSEDITVSTLAVKGKRGRPKKTAAKPEKKAKVAKEEKPAKKAVAKGTVVDPRVETRRLGLLLLQILHNSTAMPFARRGNTYQCFFCQKICRKTSDLKEHTANHEDFDKKCLNMNRGVLKFFIKLDVTELKCKKCDEEFDSLRNFLTHFTEAHEGKVDMELLKYIDSYKLTDSEMKCLICDESFPFFNHLQRHIVRLHKIGQFKCENCGIGFATKTNLAMHLESVHESKIKIYACNQCSKKFATLYKLTDHEKRIHDLKATTCHICKEVLGSTHRKATHMADVHNVRQAEFKCESCPKIFYLAGRLANHKRRIHLKEKTKVCDICGDKFFDDYNLKLHKVKHSDTKPYECNICKKRFPRKKALVLHTRIHTGDKRHVCEDCGKAFVQATSLKLHERLHYGSGEKAPN